MNKQWAGIMIGLAVSMIACKKDPVTSPLPAEQKLVVNMKAGGVPVSQIDSGNVVLRRQGTITPYFFRFQKGTDKLEAHIDGLPAGQYTADFDLYTKQQSVNTSLQFVSTRAITINASGHVMLNGPTNPPTDGWRMRQVKATNDNDIVVITPLDVNDPYFEIRTKGSQWDLFGVERLALFGSVVVAHKTWNCVNNNCIGNDRLIFDNAHFLPFTQMIQNNNWTRNEIVVTVGNIQNQQYFEFNHVWNN